MIIIITDEQTGKDLTVTHPLAVWGVTVTCPLAESYIEGAAREAGGQPHAK